LRGRGANPRKDHCGGTKGVARERIRSPRAKPVKNQPKTRKTNASTTASPLSVLPAGYKVQSYRRHGNPSSVQFVSTEPPTLCTPSAANLPPSSTLLIHLSPPYPAALLPPTYFPSSSSVPSFPQPPPSPPPALPFLSLPPPPSFHNLSPFLIPHSLLPDPSYISFHISYSIPKFFVSPSATERVSSLSNCNRTPVRGVCDMSQRAGDISSREDITQEQLQQATKIKKRQLPLGRCLVNSDFWTEEDSQFPFAAVRGSRHQSRLILNRASVVKLIPHEKPSLPDHSTEPRRCLAHHRHGRSHQSHRHGRHSSSDGFNIRDMS